MREVLLACMAVALAGCAETQLFFQSAKTIGGAGETEQGGYKVGKPYQIAGVWYYPKADYEYRETGIASWYGPKFHGKPTANGEIFDMNEVSAAHRTLPLPSIVRVTNLDNGRAINVRVNDRGPFAHGRIIDLSRRAAQLLGFEQQGTAPVQVEILAAESQHLAMLASGQPSLAESAPKPEAAPRGAVTSQTLAPPPGTKAAPPPSPDYKVAAVENVPLPDNRPAPSLARVDEQVTVVPVKGQPKIYVQAGAFSRFENAHRTQARLTPVGRADITQVNTDQRLFRVRLGPIGDVDEADRLLEAVIRAGFPDARVVVD